LHQQHHDVARNAPLGVVLFGVARCRPRQRRGTLVIALGVAGIALAVLYSTPSVQLTARRGGPSSRSHLACCQSAEPPGAGSTVGLHSLSRALPVGLWVMLILLINGTGPQGGWGPMVSARSSCG
jgi:hypothetical protein